MEYSGALDKHVLDDPPPFHIKLLDWGERPVWHPDGTKLAFVETSFGDICEIDLISRQVTHLTRGKGYHHTFLRVLYMPNGDYLLTGPPRVNDPKVSRWEEAELWYLHRSLTNPPVSLGIRICEGVCVSQSAPRIAFSMRGRNDPANPDPDGLRAYTATIEYTEGIASLSDQKLIYERVGGHVEPQDFRNNDTEVIWCECEVTPPIDPSMRPVKCIVRGIDTSTGDITTYIDVEDEFNECEGIFPDQEYICLESSCDAPNSFPPRNLWKLKLDGSGRRARMTDMPVRWKATNSNVSPDGRWLAFMVSLRSDTSGFGRGLGLMDLHAWEASVTSGDWEQPATN